MAETTARALTPLEPQRLERFSCMSCGLLGKLNVDRPGQQWPSPGLWQITAIERQAGEAFEHTPSASDGIRRTEPFCLARVVNLMDEVWKELGRDPSGGLPPLDEKLSAARKVFQKDRSGQCKDAWCEYTPGFTPNEHLAEKRMLERERQNKKTQRDMLLVTIAGVTLQLLLAVVAIVSLYIAGKMSPPVVNVSPPVLNVSPPAVDVSPVIMLPPSTPTANAGGSQLEPYATRHFLCDGTAGLKDCFGNP